MRICSSRNTIAAYNYPSDFDTSIVTNCCYLRQTGSTFVNSTNSAPGFVDQTYYDGLTITSGSQLGTNFTLGPNGLSGLKLVEASVCRNTGTNQAWMVSGTDYAENARVNEEIVDMGAFEYTVNGAVTINPTLYFLAHQLSTEGHD
jgi:hypothetical protein